MALDRMPLPWDRAAIEAVLPHRDPFLFIDQVTALVPGRLAVGFRTFSGAEFFFPGHFPGYPIVPGVVVIEALAQLGAVAILCLPEADGQLVLFGGIDHARFRAPVLPGATVRLEIEITARRGPIGKGSAKAYLVHGKTSKLAAEAELTFALTPQASRASMTKPTPT
jgi:3-hydroxyacyl-[acyl-carrier-protein] dehydratase